MKTTTHSQKKATLLLCFLFFFFYNFIQAQDDTPCECAQRWTGGAAWNPDGTVNDSNSAGPPNGIIKCASAASTQSNIISEGCTYNSSQFEIDLTQFPTCISPNTGVPVTLNGPQEGCEILWLNFDVRPNAGSYDYQIIGGGIGWALYNVDDVVATTSTDPITNLSGDCNVLEPLACGDAFGNSFVTFEVPAFPNASNLYLAIWDETECVPSPAFSINFKARFGCGNPAVCVLETPEPAVAECSPTGSTYTVTVPISGINGTYVAIDNNTGIAVSPAVVLTSEADAGPVTTGTIVATYPSGTDYNFTITETAEAVDNFSECTATFSGISPMCCTLEVDCSALTTTNLSCLTDIPAPDNSLVNVTNSCNPPVITSADVTAGGNGCPDTPITVTRTYTVTDGAESEDCIQTFVLTTPAPSIACPASLTVECLADIVPGTATASDGCAGALTVVPSAPVLSSGSVCCDGAVYQITYSAVDVCGRATSCTQNFTLDNAAPTISCPAAMTVECLADVVPGTATVTTSCGLGSNAVTTSAPVLTSGQAGCAGAIYQITYSVEDECGRAASCTQAFTLDNAAPTISCPAAMTVECLADVVPGTAAVTTSCGLGSNAVTTSAPVLTSGQAGCAGAVYQIIYSVEDECGRAASCTQDFSIVNTAPVVSCPADLTVTCVADIAPVIPTFTSACGLTTNGFTVGAAMLTSGTAGCDGAVYQILYSITDNCGQTVSCTQNFTLMNAAPTITCPAPQTVNCVSDIEAGTPVSFSECDLITDDFTVSEPILTTGTALCDNAIYTLTYSVADVCGRTASCTQDFTLNTEGPVITCPANQTVICFADITPGIPAFETDCNLGTLPIADTAPTLATGTANCGGAVYEIVYTVTDICGESAACTQQFILNPPPTEVIFEENTTVECFADINPQPEDLTFTVGCGLGGDVTITAGAVNGGENCNGTTAEYLYELTTDCGEVLNFTRTYTIANEGIVLENCTETVIISCFNELPPVSVFDLDFTSACGSETEFSFTEGYADNDVCTGQFIREYVLTDDCGNEESCTVTWQLENQAPVIVSPGDLTLDLTDTPREELIQDWINSMQVEGSCGVSVADITNNYDPEGFVEWGCSTRTGTQEVTFSSVSECGIETLMTASIYLNDFQAPSCAVQGDLTIACDDPDFENTLDTWLAYDGNITDFNIPVAVTSDFPADFVYTDAQDGMEITWTATDVCGNASVFSALLTIIDENAPVIINPAQDMSLIASQNTVAEIQNWQMTQAGAIAEDNCDADLTWTQSPEDILTGIDSDFSGATVTFTVTDDFGNSVSTTATVSIEGTLPLQFLEFPADRAVDCATGAGAPDMPTVVYNCQPPTSEMTETFIEGECCNDSYLHRTRTFTDDCGYQCERTQIISFYDNTAPTFTFTHPELENAAAGDTIGLFSSEMNIAALGADAVDDVSAVCTITEEVTILDTLNCSYGNYLYLMRLDLTATDDCGNSGKFEVYVRYTDDIPPVFVYVPEDQSIGCNTPPVFPEAIAEDNHGIAYFYYQDVVSGVECPGISYVTRHWTAIDVCNNAVTASSQIEIKSSGDLEATGRSFGTDEVSDRKDELMFVPTVAKEQIALTFTQKQDGRGVLRIYDIRGQQVIQRELTWEAGENRTFFDIDDLPSGVYFAVLPDGKNNRTGRFFKIR